MYEIRPRTRRVMTAAEQVLPERTVLIVEDDRDVQDALRETLEDDGYDVRCARHGAEALSYLRRNPAPAVILLDLFMPVMNGWNFVRHLQQSSQLADIPVVVLTAAKPHWGRPVERVLQKPVSVDHLLGAIREACS